MPRWHIVTSLCGLGPIPWRMLPPVLWLVSEQRLLGIRRDPATRTHGEALQETRGLSSCHRIIRAGTWMVERFGAKARRLAGRIRRLQRDIELAVDDVVTGPYGEALTASQAATLEEQHQETVRQEQADGSLKHRRVGRRMRRWVKGVVVIDFPVLGYFLGGIFNVYWSDPASTPYELAITLIFAVLGTAGVALALHWFGRTLKPHKGDHGHLQLSRDITSLTPALELVAFAGVLIGTAWVMAYRIVTDAEEAGVTSMTGWVLGGFFAVITITVNWVIFSIEFRDGSTLTERIDHLAGQLKRLSDRQQAARRRITKLQQQIALVQQRGEEVAARTYSAAGEPLRATHQTLLTARSYHQGTGPEAPALIDPNSEYGPAGHLPLLAAADIRALDLALDHLRHPEANPQRRLHTASEN